SARSPCSRSPMSCRSSPSLSARSRSCSTSATKSCSATWPAMCSRRRSPGTCTPKRCRPGCAPSGSASRWRCSRSSSMTQAARRQNGVAPEVASYRDLGAFQLLLSLQDDDALVSYCRGVLGPIEQGEGDYGGELLRSLDVFIEHNGHWEKAAAALFCHRHTLRY